MNPQSTPRPRLNAKARTLRDISAYLKKEQKNIGGELAAGVAHDFNNLLTVFHGYTELIQADLPPGSHLHEYLNEMVGAVERAKTLTSQLLNFSSNQHGAPVVIRLGAVLLEFRKMLRRIIPDNIELVIAVGEKDAWVLMHPRRLETVLLNLAFNACEAMPEGGRLALELVEAGSDVQIVVADTGIGMDRAVADQIFEPGFTTKNPARGFGFGLSTCVGIVKQGGGKITVESIPGKGSVFTVLLPQSESPTPGRKRDGVQNARAIFSGTGRKALVVEDDAAVRTAMVTMLRRLGFEVFRAANGDRAQRILEQDGEIPLVITDLVMPLMDGLELVEIIRRRWPKTRVIVTSGYTIESPENIDPTNKYLAFLPKPLSSNALAHKLRELLDI